MVMNITVSLCVCVCAGSPRLFTAPPPLRSWITDHALLVRSVVYETQACKETYTSLAEDGAVLLFVRRDVTDGD